MRILIIGHKQHGKTELANCFERLANLRYLDSSYFAGRRAVFHHFPHGSYKSYAECHADRNNHRKFWHDKILDYNTPDRTRLAREIWARCPVYVGMRNREEFLAIEKDLPPDIVIWCDASKIRPLESEESFQLTEEDADITFDNNDMCPKKMEKFVHDTIYLLSNPEWQ